MSSANEATAPARFATETGQAVQPDAVGPTVEEIRNWLAVYVADVLDMRPEEVSVSTPFERLGLDSAAGVALTGDLAAWLGRELDPNLTGELPTIEAVASALGSDTERRL
jgi:acyl carrier protein